MSQNSLQSLTLYERKFIKDHDGEGCKPKDSKFCRYTGMAPTTYTRAMRGDPVRLHVISRVQAAINIIKSGGTPAPYVGSRIARMTGQTVFRMDPPAAGKRPVPEPRPDDTELVEAIKTIHRYGFNVTLSTR